MKSDTQEAYGSLSRVTNPNQHRGIAYPADDTRTRTLEPESGLETREPTHAGTRIVSLGICAVRAALSSDLRDELSVIVRDGPSLPGLMAR